MTRSQLGELLRASQSVSVFFQTYVLSATPWIFRGDREAFEAWRRDVADAAGIEPGSLFLVGSAATGYSLSPYKAGRAFKPVVAGERVPSDIDMAVVDADLFTATWNNIVTSDRQRTFGRVVSEAGYRGTLSEAMSKVRFDIYHGAVTDVHAAPGSEPAARLRTLFAATTRRSPFQGHRARARLYRRREDFLAYHDQSLRQLLSTLSAE